MTATKGADWLADAVRSDASIIIDYLNELEEKHELEARESERKQKRHNWILGAICALLGALFAAAITYLALQFLGLQL